MFLHYFAWVSSHNVIFKTEQREGALLCFYVPDKTAGNGLSDNLHSNSELDY